MDRDVDLAAADREDFPKSVIQHSVPNVRRLGPRAFQSSFRVLEQARRSK